MEKQPMDPRSGTFRTEMVLLLDFYGNALTERQRRTAELYFQEDLSLTEIAEITGITRQGVRDGLKKAEKALLDMEERLGIAQRFLKQKKALSKARSAAEALPESDKRTAVLEYIDAAINEA